MACITAKNGRCIESGSMLWSPETQHNHFLRDVQKIELKTVNFLRAFYIK